jgi:hypothetical protein
MFSLNQYFLQQLYSYTYLKFQDFLGYLIQELFFLHHHLFLILFNISRQERFRIGCNKFGSISTSGSITKSLSVILGCGKESVFVMLPLVEIEPNLLHPILNLSCREILNKIKKK